MAIWNKLKIIGFSDIKKSTYKHEYRFVTFEDTKTEETAVRAIFPQYKILDDIKLYGDDYKKIRSWPGKIVLYKGLKCAVFL